MTDMPGFTCSGFEEEMKARALQKGWTMGRVLGEFLEKTFSFVPQ
jgi:hypothetical protein